MKDKKALAVIVGEAWAKRMFDKQASNGATVGGDWPGRTEDVAILVEPLSDDADERRVLVRVILSNARRAWLTMTQRST